MDRDRIEQLIDKVRAGRATAGERLELEQFFEWAHNDERLFNELTNDEKEMIRREMLHGINRRIAAIERRGPLTRTLSMPLMRIAASLTMITTLAILYYWISADSARNLKTSSGYGELAHVILPDSSEVTLNGNSHIRYEDSWSDKEDREVWLSGEGFFEVRHTRNHNRFIVHTDEGMDVQVLGTRFNVKVRRGKAQIMLEEGRVRLSSENDINSDTATLSPGELATYQRGVLLKQYVDPALHASWKDHKLYFDATPLAEVAQMLEDTYGYKVDFVHASLASRKLSGQIQSREVSDLFLVMEESLGIDIQVTGKMVKIYRAAQ